MPESAPNPISADEHAARLRRTTQIARRMGFVGRVEYLHAYSQAGGAQYGLAAAPGLDLLVVFAEAFERDADPDDFSLEAIIAHERGHQVIARHERLARNLPATWSGVTEEIVASLLGSLLVNNDNDRQDLVLKAMFEAERHGLESDRAMPLIAELRGLLELIL